MGMRDEDEGTGERKEKVPPPFNGGDLNDERWSRGGRGRGRGVRSVEGRHEVSRMGEFRGRKPLVIGGRVAKPVHEVVERGADETQVKNRLDFEVFSAINEVR